jgi:hypothetical protein
MSYEHFVELLLDKVQIAALSFMALMYAIKIRSLMKKPPIGDRTPKRGDPDAGMRYAMMTIAMPWETESYRKHPMKYVEFALFHVAVAAAITSTLIIPYTELMIVPTIAFLSVALIGMGLVCGVSRLLRRILSPAMRAVSSFDDYFAIILLNVYMLVACMAIPRSGNHEDAWVVAFFALTTFFLIYVPFSKISHYVLWPFNRYYVGKHFGKRGVYPKKAHNFGPQGA